MATWASALAAATATVWFVHECAHGIGYAIHGARVSTGFNMVGSPGKLPGDAAFRAAVPVTGTPNWGTFLGPFTNWLVACACTAGFLRRPRGKKGLVLAAGALGAALPRVLSLATFFGGAIVGRVVYQDEIEWGAKAVPGTRFPTSFPAFETMIRSHSREFLATARVYLWPGVSMAICAGCMALVYRQLRRVHAMSFGPHRRLAMTLPFAGWALVGIVFAALDRVIRINW